MQVMEALRVHSSNFIYSHETLTLLFLSLLCPFLKRRREEEDRKEEEERKSYGSL